MSGKSSIHELFKTSNLMLLIGFSIFSVLVAVETFLLGWEKWALILIVLAVGICW